MALKSESKVGVIVASAILALIAIYWFLGGLGLRKSSYPVYAIFSDVGRLDKGADVRLAGVKVGLVSLVKLTADNKARVEMLIWKDNPIPEDSVARITTGAFIGDHYVEILPGSKYKRISAGGRLRTGRQPQFEDLMEETTALVTDLRSAAEAINSILGDEELVAALKNTVEDLNTASDSASELFRSANVLLGRTSPEIERIFANLASAAADVDRVTSRADRMLSGSIEPNMDSIMSDAASAVSNLNDAVGEARLLVENMRAGAASANTVLGKIDNAAEKADALMTTLQEAGAGLRDITTDPHTQENLRKAIENAAAATEQAKQVLTRLNEKFDGREKPAGNSSVTKYGTVVNSLWNTDRGSYRFDAGYTFGGAESFYRVGVRDIGESGGLNVQLGRTLDRYSAFRYGVYGSRVGLGYDRRMGSALISADVFRPNDPELELRAVIDVGEGLGFYAGLTDVWQVDDSDLLVGLTYQR